MPTGRIVTAEEIQQLLEDPQWVIDTEIEAYLSARRITSRVYAHPDGRLLDIFSQREGYLFNTREYVRSLMQGGQNVEHLKRTHALIGRLPQKEDFVAQVPELAQSLAALLGIPQAELDGSVTSLLKVDEGAQKLGCGKCLNPPIFAALIAYAGEVMRKETEGKWETRQNHEFDGVYEPWIVTLDGRSLNPWEGIAVTLSEGNSSFSIFVPVLHELKRPLTPPPPPRSRRGGDFIIVNRKPDESSSS